MKRFILLLGFVAFGACQSIEPRSCITHEDCDAEYYCHELKDEKRSVCLKPEGENIDRPDLVGCGNGRLDPGEECDDSNTLDQDSCTSDCRVSRCGDGKHRNDLSEGSEGFEACDDGNEIETDECLNNCRLARCGDGVARADLGDGHPDYEFCDDGNGNDADICTNTCVMARCGDGITRLDVDDDGEPFETCDDGDDNQDIGNCTSICRTARCGDGLKHYVGLTADHPDYEACDDGNDNDNDACTNLCVEARCGDAITRSERDEGGIPLEECDDGNEVETDSCDSCTLARCGDGIIRTDLAPGAEGHEACDDGDDALLTICINCQFDPASFGGIALGAGFSCARVRRGEDVSLRCWGRNGQGQAQDGYEPSDEADFSRDNMAAGPVDSTSLSDVEAVVASAHGLCARASDRAVCWGLNVDGHLGIAPVAGLPTSTVYRPTVVAGLDGVRNLAMGEAHSCSIVDTQEAAGRLACWGRNVRGQLGRELQNGSSSWQAGDAAGFENVEQVVAGSDFTAALNSDGQVQFVGTLRDAVQGTVLAAVPGIPAGVLSISGGLDHLCAVTADGAIWCGGFNDYFQLGSEGGESTTTRVARRRFVQVEAYRHGTCGLTASGEVYCWGSNLVGQLARPRSERASDHRPTRIDFGPDARVTALGRGGQASHRCAALEGDELRCWGDNAFYAVGHPSLDAEIIAPFDSDFTGRRDGSEDHPAFNCSALGRAHSDAAIRAWVEAPDGSGPIPVLCDHETQGGGWTLALRVADGTDPLFAYESELWTNSAAHNLAAIQAADRSYKGAAFWALPFSETMLLLRESAEAEPSILVLGYDPQSSLQAVFASAGSLAYSAPEPLSLDDWRAWAPSDGFHLTAARFYTNNPCVYKGFNARYIHLDHPYARARLGIVTVSRTGIQGCGYPGRPHPAAVMGFGLVGGDDAPSVGSLSQALHTGNPPHFNQPYSGEIWIR